MKPMTPSIQTEPEPSSSQQHPHFREGKVRTAVLLWALGVPLPLVLIFLLIRGCTG